MVNGEFCTYIHDKCQFEGTMTFEGTTRVDGKLKGAVYSHHVLIVGKNGFIEGDIHVGSLIVYGHVKGRVVAGNRVEAKGAAIVEAEVHAPIVQFDEGTRFDGRVHMSLLDQ